MNVDAVTLAILAGGEGRRMGGRVKAFLPFGGEPLIERIVGRLDGLFAERLVVLRKAAPPFTELGVPIAEDLVPGAGLPGAILTALVTATTPWCLVVGCDMPWVSPSVAAHLCDLRAGVDVVLPVRQGYAEPLFALYRREGCLPALSRMVEWGERRVASLYSQVEVRRVEHLVEADGADPFTNLNCENDYQRALSLSAQREQGRCFGAQLKGMGLDVSTRPRVAARSERV